ncbi:hypothetical protein STENM327S_04490 [Streptomyces tendae]
MVIANAGRENAPSLPSTFVTVPTPPMIMPPRDRDGAAETRSRRPPPPIRRLVRAAVGAADRDRVRPFAVASIPRQAEEMLR